MGTGQDKSDRPLRVVQLSFALAPPDVRLGYLETAWRTSFSLARATAAAGVEVLLLVSGGRDEQVRDVGLDVRMIEEPGAQLVRGGAFVRPRRLVETIRGFRPDVVHVHGLGHPLALGYAARRLGRLPILVQDHANKVPHAAARRWHAWALRRIAGAAFVSKDQAQPFLDARVLRRSTPIFELVEASSEFAPGDSAAARRALGVEGEPVVLWIGRLNDNKDPLTMLEGIARASRSLPGLRLYICFHEAPLLERVERRIRVDPQLRDRVELIGARPHAEIERWLQAADFYVSSSRFEGSGYALIEAMATGAIPIVTRIPSFRRLTEEGQVGALFDVADPEGLATALLERWSADRADPRTAARAHFERRLSWSAIGRNLVEIYRRLAEGTADR